MKQDPDTRLKLELVSTTLSKSKASKMDLAGYEKANLNRSYFENLHKVKKFYCWPKESH